MDEVPRSAYSVLREAFVTGLAVVVPLVVTLLVLAIALNYVSTYLDILVEFAILLFQSAGISIQRRSDELFLRVIAPIVLLLLIVGIGLLTTSSTYGELAVDYFDFAISKIPGVGAVYESFRQMSDVMLETDTGNFQEVKLVEFPVEGSYTLAFVTSETPAKLRPPSHDEMLTLFLPLAPNPVMGGHVIHVAAEKVYDVDMTVEEGIRTIVTSGVAVGQEGAAGLSSDQLAAITTAGLDVDPRDAQAGLDRRSEDRRETYQSAAIEEVPTDGEGTVPSPTDKGDRYQPGGRTERDASDDSSDGASESEEPTGDEADKPAGGKSDEQ